MNYMEDIKLTPMPGWLIVKPSIKKSASGLYLPSGMGEQPSFGIVVSCGGLIERTDEKYEKPILIKEGDVVHFGKWNGMAVKINNEDFMFLKYQEILAIER
jgi:co-chaperonin GroES (HSP10)